MARMPGAIWHPLAADWNKQPRMKAYDFFCLHTMVGTLAGTGDYFAKSNGIGYAGTESHFGVGPDGTIWQFQDTDYQADANGDGNWHVISSENADMGAPFPKWSGSDVPAFTAGQVEANARIAVFLNRTHGIPLTVAGSSKRGARGMAVHRYGVPGYMPAGAEQWSSSQGKSCPGDRRVAQLPQVSTRAQQLASGSPILTEDDMPLNDADKATIRSIVREEAGWAGSGAPLIQNLRLGRGEFPATVLGALEQRLASGEVSLPGVAALQGRIDGLSEALRQIAAAPGQAIDLTAVEAAAKRGTAAAIKAIDVTVHTDA